ncbi:pyridoxal phosphate enzyme [Methanocaldococcus villosus KIN24-T80]|uniref:Pyridoxal phosphate enzyme n=1 Tax=Methanocaldococcus villosus KIN24-T80 TaxID=1069083 RepID=N6UWU0_9EURY|nr:TIGR03576 family pyridoxal phosphate-dependent enzyme [Methanocaldococcus villosus]ENN96809.1 pyridoxal phosphate enzyme [Methanocaldococcus villosus KIN24-T80]
MKDIERLERAKKLILKILNEKGREYLYDLSGLSGGFLIEENDKELLTTYIGSQYFLEKVNDLGLKHLGGSVGDRCIALNRTTSAILATVLTLKPKHIYHYLPELPGHPSIRRAAEIVNAYYEESDNLNILKKANENSLAVITGTTMDLKVINLELFKEAIEIAKEKSAIILVDDASGARIRLLYGQPPALKLGADLVVTSTDKLMHGPRAGLLAGKKEIVDEIYITALKYGLEAQPPILAGIYRALEKFNLDHLKKVFNRAKNLDLSKLDELDVNYERTATGFVVKDVNEEVGFYLLEKYGILTILVFGAPGSSRNLRIDLFSNDAERLSDEYIINAVVDAIKRCNYV